MNKEQIKSAFSQIKSAAGQDEKLTAQIMARIDAERKSFIPVSALKNLAKFFCFYLLASLALYFAVMLFLPTPGSVGAADVSSEAWVGQIAEGWQLFITSERLINSFINGCFNLFFKLSFLAFFFAAALMKANDSDSCRKGEKLCAD